MTARLPTRHEQARHASRVRETQGASNSVAFIDVCAVAGGDGRKDEQVNVKPWSIAAPRKGGGAIE